MTTGNKHLNFVIFLLFSILLFYSCRKTNTSENLDFTDIVKTINKIPINNRIAKWDSLLKLHENDTLTGYLYYQKAYTFYFMHKDKEALQNFKSAIKFLNKTNNKGLLAKSYIYFGAIYSSLGEQNIASQYILRGLQLAKKLNDSDILSLAYSQMAYFFYQTGDYDKSIEYQNKSAAIYKKAGKIADLIMVYNNIAVLYLSKDLDKEALDYFLKIKNLNPEKNYVGAYNLVVLYDNLGYITYNVTKNKDRALKYLRKSLEISRKNDLKPFFTYKYIALIYEKTNQIDSAKYYAQKSIEANDYEDYQTLVYTYDMLIRLNLMQKKDTSLLNLINIKDSLSELNQKVINDYKKKALKKNVMLLNQQKELSHAKKINKKNKIIFIFIVMMFILGLILSFQFNRFDVLKHKQELIILEQKILRSQMNPHFIFNVLSSIQNSLLEKNSIESATYLSKFAKLMRQNFDFIQKKHILLKEELDMIKNYLDTQKFRFKYKFDYIINVDDKLKTEDYLIPPMILQPFVENAIKHGFTNIPYKGLITINVLKKDDKICFEIIDNGAGYNPAGNRDNKEHALDIFKKRLFTLGKNAYDSFKINRLEQGTKVEFCFDIIKS